MRVCKYSTGILEMKGGPKLLKCLNLQIEKLNQILNSYLWKFQNENFEKIK